MRLTEQVHRSLQTCLRPGDLCIDATAGNGHDTLAMAQWVGNRGRVIAIDLQAAAIEATKTRLSKAGYDSSCTLIEGDHSRILPELAAKCRGKARAITFNLGYLPGSDKTVMTHGDSTLPALDVAAKLLGPDGTLFVTAYRGHPGGAEEAASVAKWMLDLSRLSWTVNRIEPQSGDRSKTPPILWIARKKKGGSEEPPTQSNEDKQ